jgi:hypothetical protein
MANENTGQQQTPTPPAQSEERAIRESAWQVIQQGAQVFGATGVGAGGFATALHLAKARKGGGTPSEPPQPPAPPDARDKP